MRCCYDNSHSFNNCGEKLKVYDHSSKEFGDKIDELLVTQ